jgi:hypothetical protein
MKATAQALRTRRLAELRQQEERERQRQRDEVRAELGDDPDRLADEILRLRHGVRQSGRRAAWLQDGLPFIAFLGPRQRETHEPLDGGPSDA